MTTMTMCVHIWNEATNNGATFNRPLVGSLLLLLLRWVRAVHVHVCVVISRGRQNNGVFFFFLLVWLYHITISREGSSSSSTPVRSTKRWLLQNTKCKIIKKRRGRQKNHSELGGRRRRGALGGGDRTVYTVTVRATVLLFGVSGNRVASISY